MSLKIRDFASNNGEENVSGRAKEERMLSPVDTMTPLRDGAMRTGIVPDPAGDPIPGEDLTPEAHQGTQDSRKCPDFVMRNPSLDHGILREIYRSAIRL